MNNDLISREALKKALHNFFDGKVINEPAYILRDVFCHIDNAPTVTNGTYEQGFRVGAYGRLDEIRPQGEWIRVDKYKVKCNKCEVIHYIAQYPNSAKINYCPNCGHKC